MMVIFQNRIIYIPSSPPFSRSERTADYAGRCRPVEWREQRITASDGTSIALAVGSMPLSFTEDRCAHHTSARIERHKVIVIFRGECRRTDAGSDKWQFLAVGTPETTQHLQGV